MAGSRKARHVSHLRAGNEREARRLRQSEQILEPCAGHFFDDGFRGTACVNGGILIPHRCQPVGRKRGGQRAPDDPTEETATGAADNPSMSVANKLVDYLRRAHTSVRQGTIKAG